MTLDEAKAKFVSVKQAVEDRYDSFIASRLQQTIAVFIMGVVVGSYLGYSLK